MLAVLQTMLAITQASFANMSADYVCYAAGHACHYTFKVGYVFSHSGGWEGDIGSGALLCNL